MIPTLHSPRGRLRSLTARASALVLVALMVASSQAQAVVTFSYTGSHSLTWTTNTTKYLTISRTGGYTPLTVHAYLSGSSKFSLNTSSLVWLDSTLDTGYMFPRTLAVSYSSTVADSDFATLILADSNRSDTIHLKGYGTVQTHDFALCDSIMNIWVYHDSSGNNTVTAQTDNCVTNLQASAITVKLFIMDSTNFTFAGGAGNLTLNLNALARQSFTVYYKGHGMYQTKTQIMAFCSSPYSQQGMMEVDVTDPTLQPHFDKPQIVAPNLGWINPGDSACDVVVISNPNSRAITITYIGYDSSHSRWSASGRANTPLTLLPAGVTTFTLCYHADSNDMNAGHYGDVYVGYRDSKGNTGVVNATAYVSIHGLIDAYDSTRLDDVVLGGYVEASAWFVAHKAVTMTASSGTVDQGGSVEILSPSLPLRMKAGDSVEVRYRVWPNPDSGSYYEGRIPVHFDNATYTLAFWGNTAVRTASDSAHGLSIYANQNELIAMRTSNHVVIDTFWFTNNYGGVVKVSDAKLSSGAHFHILGYLPGSLPITLSANQSMGIIMQFNGDTSGFYRDSLYLDASHNIWSQPINVQAVVTQSASVQRGASPTSASIFVSPNPAIGPVEIAVAGARTARIEIYDLLGNRIATLPNALGASWNADGMSGGAYIVRASGTDANGDAYSITKRLILVR